MMILQYLLLYKIVNLFNYKGFKVLFRGNGVVAFLVCPPPDPRKVSDCVRGKAGWMIRQEASELKVHGNREAE